MIKPRHCSFYGRRHLELLFFTHDPIRKDRKPAINTKISWCVRHRHLLGCKWNNYFIQSVSPTTKSANLCYEQHGGVKKMTLKTTKPSSAFWFVSLNILLKNKTIRQYKLYRTKKSYSLGISSQHGSAKTDFLLQIENRNYVRLTHCGISRKWRKERESAKIHSTNEMDHRWKFAPHSPPSLPLCEVFHQRFFSVERSSSKKSNNCKLIVWYFKPPLTFPTISAIWSLCFIVSGKFSSSPFVNIAIVQPYASVVCIQVADSRINILREIWYLVEYPKLTHVNFM